ncbi:hypothetical protein BDA99DRAFT_542577 [Phascolomyces articulosus]|uniref:Uncharacterized protein n=1 Tax=Phascolomyces articulosus TaxID=60185 RepID=A0AAD5JP31_9FUNG|nr:hypothetical protein BDA99DRAFT_542577 [Phascolomyces articulosus]
MTDGIHIGKFLMITLIFILIILIHSNISKKPIGLYGPGVNHLYDHEDSIGLDFGEVCVVASVFRPSNPNEKVTQLVIKRGYLYGRMVRNQKWLQERKVCQGSSEIESAMIRGSPRSS